MILLLILINAFIIVYGQSINFQETSYQGIPINAYCVRLLNDKIGSIGCQGEYVY